MPAATCAAAEALVRAFFAALDRRDADAMTDLFSPDAVVIHQDGVRTRVPEFQAIVRSAARWPERTRTLSGFECVSRDAILIVGCRNEIRVRGEQGWIVTTYAETWILERDDSGLRALRCHYSRVTADEHREDSI